MTKTTSLDDIKRDAGAAILLRLASHPLADLTHQDLADDTGHDVAVIRRVFPDLVECVEQGLKDIDDGVATALASDFADDPDATTRERILEGLTVRYEAYAPHKDAIRSLNKSSAMNPLLAAAMINRLSRASHTLLELAGLDVSGLKGLLRVKGLAGVALSVQRDWFADDSADLSTTMRALDQRLTQAEGLAEMLNIISAEPSAKKEDEEHDG